MAAAKADHVLRAPDDVVPAHGAEQEHLQAEGGGAHVAVAQDEPAKQSALRRIGGVVDRAIPVHEEQKQVAVPQVGARRHLLGPPDAVLVAERQMPSGMGLHEVHHPTGQLVVVHAVASGTHG